MASDTAVLVAQTSPSANESVAAPGAEAQTSVAGGEYKTTREVAEVAAGAREYEGFAGDATRRAEAWEAWEAWEVREAEARSSGEGRTEA